MPGIQQLFVYPPSRQEGLDGEQVPVQDHSNLYDFLLTPKVLRRNAKNPNSLFIEIPKKHSLQSILFGNKIQCLFFLSSPVKSNKEH